MRDAHEIDVIMPLDGLVGDEPIDYICFFSSLLPTYYELGPSKLRFEPQKAAMQAVSPEKSSSGIDYARFDHIDDSDDEPDTAFKRRTRLKAILEGDEDASASDSESSDLGIDDCMRSQVREFEQFRAGARTRAQ